MGCPVALAFFHSIDHTVVMSDQQSWDDLIAKAGNERPDLRHVVRCAVLAVAFQIEEIAFACVRAKMGDAARSLREVPKPIRSGEDLQPLMDHIQPLFEVIAAESVQFKLMGEDLSSEQLKQKALEGIKRSLTLSLSCASFLRNNWQIEDALEGYCDCGRQLGNVCAILSAPHSRRLAYGKTLLGEH